MSAAGSRVAALTKELWIQWQRTREEWSDAKSLEFQQKYLEELVAGVEKSMTVVDELEKLMNKIRRDCE